MKLKEEIRIPKERVGPLVKERGRIEKQLKVKISIRANLVEIEGSGIELYQARQIVKAIGRGFAPQKAFRLLDFEQELDVIELPKNAERIKARIIGSRGRTREMIERCTKANISVYGKTVAVIGRHEQVENAKKAIGMLIKGAMHSRVYRFLERLK